MSARHSYRNLFAPIVHINGLFLLILGMSEWAIAIIDLFFFSGNYTFFGESYEPFFISGALTNLIGVVALYANTEETTSEMSMRQVLLAMISAWLVACFAATLPFMLGAPNLGFSYAVFESVSALTTTGATVITGLDELPKSILLWRSLLHWYGGMGVVIGALVLFPAMRIGGMQFFLRLGFETHDKVLPSAKAIGLATFGVYILGTLICSMFLNMTGLTNFEAINLSMSIMATGGMAVSDASFANYSDASQLVATLFMLLAGMPLIVFLLMLRGNARAFWDDLQIHTFLRIYLLIILGIIAYRLLNEDIGAWKVFVETSFASASMLTGTGLSNGDFQNWGSFPTMILFFSMFIGGCTGSTSGAVKIFRYQVLIEMIRVKIKSIHHPHGVFTPKYGGEKLDQKVIESVAAFFMIYLATLAILTVSFDIWGLDSLTGFSAAVSAVGNVGPGLGDKIGPIGNYASFNMGSLWTYTTCMIVGRLEFMSFMVLLLPRFWRH